MSNLIDINPLPEYVRKKLTSPYPDRTLLTGGIEALSMAMLTEIGENSHKGDFLAWSPAPWHLREEIIHHADKLAGAMQSHTPDMVTEYAADIANYALKAFLLYPSPRYWDAGRRQPIRRL